MAVEELDLIQVAASLNKLADRMDAFLDHHQSGNVQTLIHKTEGLSPWALAAIVACFCTWFGLILVMLDMHDMRAWVDILRQRTTILEGKQLGR